MISMKANGRRDIGLDASGRLAFVETLAAVEQNCVTAMSAQMGEMIYRTLDGVPTLATVWEKHNPALFEAAARKTLQAVEGVLAIEDFTQKRDGGALHYTATLRTAAGGAIVSNTLGF